jgi:hypothetical protein
MNNQDYDRVIAQERKVLASIKEHSEKLIPEFKQITALYIHAWSIKIMKRYLANKPEITNNLEPQKLEEMKRDFKGILKEIPEITSKRFDDAQIWLHRFEIPDHELADLTYSYQMEKRSQKSINQAIRELIGLVGSLLIKYGYIDLQNDYEWEMSTSNTPLYSNNLPSRGIEHYQALNKLMERYKNILIEYVYASQNLKKAEQAKKSAEGDEFRD